MRPSRPAPNFQSMGVGRNSKLWTVREGKLASRTVFNDSHTIAHLMQQRTQWRRLGRRHCAAPPKRKHRVRRDLHDRRGTPTGGHSMSHTSEAETAFREHL